MRNLILQVVINVAIFGQSFVALGEGENPLDVDYDEVVTEISGDSKILKEVYQNRPRIEGCVKAGASMICTTDTDSLRKGEEATLYAQNCQWAGSGVVVSPTKIKFEISRLNLTPKAGYKAVMETSLDENLPELGCTLS